MQLQCPLCRLPLQLHPASNGLYCGNKHHFDPAPEGYLDLIRGKQVPTEGESRALMRAKRHFLEQGTMLPQLDALAQLLQPLAARELIHLSCGEGYYCRALAERLPEWRFAGIDRAKNAIFAANKAQPTGRFIIAEPSKAPLLANSAECLLLLDQRIKPEQLANWLAPEGYLLYVTPGPRHLWQLRTSLNPDCREHPESWPKMAPLKLVAQTRSHFTLEVDQAIRALILETSSLAWKASGSERHAFTHQGSNQLEQDWLLTLWQK